MAFNFLIFFYIIYTNLNIFKNIYNKPRTKKKNTRIWYINIIINIIARDKRNNILQII